MTTITIHTPSESTLAAIRMGNPPTLEEVAATLNRNRNREAYGCTEGTVQISPFQSPARS